MGVIILRISKKNIGIENILRIESFQYSGGLFTTRLITKEEKLEIL